MIRVGAVGQSQRPASDETSLDIRAETANQYVPRPRVAVEIDSPVRPPAA